MSVALVHDYLTQRGGAERVVLTLLEAFPGAPLHTALYDPAETFAEFRAADVRTLPIDRVPLLRRHHRLALPLLAAAFSRCEPDADVVVCSSSGWAHGVRARGRKVVYCHAPARWLYQPERYLGERRTPVRLALAALRPWLLRWDLRAARSADRYVVNSTATRDLVRLVYGIDAVVVPPPPALAPAGPSRAVSALEPGFLLCVSRLLPYKNVDVLLEAVRGLPEERLVIVGGGPEARRLRASAPPNARLLGHVADDEMRWLYRSCSAVLTAAYEDYGLTPLEAASFGKPTAALRFGGFLDTVAEGTTGLFFDRPTPDHVRAVVAELRRIAWDEEVVRAHARSFSRERFVERLRSLVLEVSAGTG